jgi:hypothetical protein
MTFRKLKVRDLVRFLRVSAVVIKVKVKFSPLQALEALRVVRG